MKAILFQQYGIPDVLTCGETPKPAPKDNEVLIRIGASSLNSWDEDILRGDFVNRMMFGIRKPKIKTLGADIAGRVEAVGKHVNSFRVGDEVWGDLCDTGWGGLAEYVCAPEKALAKKPANMNFVEAAAVPQAGLLALQGLRKGGNVQAGQSVLINGAGGGVGTYALQIAKASGAEVTVVDKGSKLSMLRDLGADHVIDYLQTDFTATGKQYDLILDVRTNRRVFEYARALKPKGAYVTVGGTTKRLLEVLILGAWIKRTRGQQMHVLMYKANQGLDDLKALIESGTIKSVIDGPYELAETNEAFRHLGTGNHKGKVVITIGDEE